MTTFERFEGRLPAMLDELSAPRLPDYADDLFARTAATRQRPGWTFLERWLPMSAIAGRFAFVPRITWRVGVVLALLLAAAVIGLVVAGSRLFRAAPPFGPAANGAIVYTSSGDLYMGDPMTGTSRLLVGGRDVDRYPVVSRDGTHILFARNVPGTDADLQIRIFVVEADGSELHAVTPTPLRDADILSVGWVPDGRRLAMIRIVDGHNELDLLDVATGQAERIAAAEGLDSLEYRPPDGQQMLFRACLQQTAAGRSDCRLFVMDADGTNRHEIAASATSSETLDLSGATWSADGRRIFVNRWTDNASFGSPGCCHLFVMNADGSDAHHFVPNDGSGVWDGVASVSPDGAYVAFVHNSNPGVSVIRADGSGPIISTGPPTPNGATWSWSPDGSRLLLHMDNAPGTAPYLVDPTGGPFTQLKWTSDSDNDWQRVAP